MQVVALPDLIFARWLGLASPKRNAAAVSFLPEDT